MNVPVVEDDLGIAESLREGLERQGFAVTHTTSGRAAIDLAPDAELILLDLGLPDLDGKEVCRQIRTTSLAPIIVLTARGDEIDRVVLLELGADDYLVKPFGFRELVARIGAVTRRTNQTAVPAATAQRIGPLTIYRILAGRGGARAGTRTARPTVDAGGRRTGPAPSGTTAPGA